LCSGGVWVGPKCTEFIFLERLDAFSVHCQYFSSLCFTSTPKGQELHPIKDTTLFLALPVASHDSSARDRIGRALLLLS